jgi:type VI protein secretion system component Hcp
MATIVNRAELCLRDRLAAELTEIELSEVTGGKSKGGSAGKVTIKPFVFTKLYDKASPILN